MFILALCMVTIHLHLPGMLGLCLLSWSNVDKCPFHSLKHLSLDNKLHGHRLLEYSTRPQGSQVKALPNIVEPGTIYPWRSGEGSSSGMGGIVRGRVTSPSPLCSALPV